MKMENAETAQVEKLKEEENKNLSYIHVRKNRSYI